MDFKSCSSEHTMAWRSNRCSSRYTSPGPSAFAFRRKWAARWAASSVRPRECRRAGTSKPGRSSISSSRPAKIVQSQGRRVTGAVFMGMGEPFLELRSRSGRRELAPLPVRCVRRCDGPSRSAQSGWCPRSTASPPRSGRFGWRSASEQRPTKKARHARARRRTHSGSEVMAAARRHSLARRQRVMLVYVCISGINVDETDALALADLVGDTAVRLDLIEVTDETGRFKPSDTRGIQPIPRCAGQAAEPARGATLFRRRRHQGGLRYTGRLSMNEISGAAGARVAAVARREVHGATRASRADTGAGTAGFRPTTRRVATARTHDALFGCLARPRLDQPGTAGRPPFDAAALPTSISEWTK